MHPGEDLHQRALAAAILSDDRMDFAWTQVQVRPDEGARGTEALGDGDGRDERRGPLLDLAARRGRLPRHPWPPRKAASCWLVKYVSFGS